MCVFVHIFLDLSFFQIVKQDSFYHGAVGWSAVCDCGVS